MHNIYNDIVVLFAIRKKMAGNKSVNVGCYSFACVKWNRVGLFVQLKMYRRDH